MAWANINYIREQLGLEPREDLPPSNRPRTTEAAINRPKFTFNVPTAFERFREAYKAMEDMKKDKWDKLGAVTLQLDPVDGIYK